MPQFETMQLVDSLRSAVCPACGGKKKYAQTLCVGCYRSLPVNLRQDLYNRVGQGYEEAFESAMLHLRVSPIHWAKPEMPA